MKMRRRAVAHPGTSFGRRARDDGARADRGAGHADFGDDLRLFALTFVGGFLFVSVYLI